MDKIDTFLRDNTDIDQLARQVEELMELHNKLVKERKIPAYKLMGLTEGEILAYSPMGLHNSNSPHQT